MPTFRHAGALLLGALLTASLPACNKKNAESPANPPTGVGTKTTPDTGGTGTAAAPAAALPSPPATTGNSSSGASGNSAAPANNAADTPSTTAPPTGQQPGR